MNSPLNAWSKRLLFEIRALIRSHADRYQHELTIGQVELLGTALREMGMSMADTAALANRLAGTSTDNEAEIDDVKRALDDSRTVQSSLHDLLDQRNYANREDEEERPRWKPRVIKGSATDPTDSIAPSDGSGPGEE